MAEFTSNEQPFVLGLGHPLLDVQANVDADFLEKYKVVPNGFALKGPDQNGLYEELLEKEIALTRVPGGCAQNTVRMIQWIFGKEASSKCAYLGCVGADKSGEVLVEFMDRSGVQTLYEVSANLETGVCLVLLNGPNRSLITSLGAASAFSPTFLCQTLAWDMVKSAHFYYISGFFMVSSMDSIRVLADHAARLGKSICFNLAAPFVAKVYSKSIDEIVPYTDFIFGGSDEALAYADAKNIKDMTVESVARHFVGVPRIGRSKRPRLVVFTQGPDSIIAMSSEDMIVHVFPVTPLGPEEIVDTNGAGDAFAAGFLADYLISGSLEEAIQSGKKAAVYIIRQSGFHLGHRSEYDI